MDINQAIELGEVINIFNEISHLIYYAFNAALKLFFNDISIFNVPIGYIMLSIVLIGAITNTLATKLKGEE